MGLLCYTTKISVTKTIGEISDLLVEAGARSIAIDYDGKNPTAISFMVETKFGLTPYRLPVNVPAAMKILAEESRRGIIPKRFINDSEQARRVAWRIQRTWVEAQVALIKLGQVELSQVMLSYMQTNNGESLYERLVESKFKGYLLEWKEKEVKEEK